MTRCVICALLSGIAAAYLKPRNDWFYGVQAGNTESASISATEEKAREYMASISFFVRPSTPMTPT